MASESTGSQPRPKLPGIILTYPESKFSPDFSAKSFEQIAQIETFTNLSPEDRHHSICQLVLYLCSEKLAQAKTALHRRNFLSLRKQSVLKNLLVMIWIVPKLFSKKFRENSRRSLSKTLNLRRAYNQIWKKAISRDSEWVLLLEDDAELDEQRIEILSNIVSSLDAIVMQGYRSIELSNSYDLCELGLEGNVIERIDFGTTEMHLLNLGATNTTCAAIFHKDALSVLLEDSLHGKRWSKYVPIDVFVSNSLVGNGLSSAIVWPGIVNHNSRFKEAGSWQFGHDSVT